MQLGIDFDGTITRYYACYKHGQCDAMCCEACETLEGAKQSINGLKRRKTIKGRDDVKFWIMKQTLKAEKVWQEENEFFDDFDDEVYDKYKDKEADAEHEKEQQKRRMWVRKRNKSIQD